MIVVCVAPKETTTGHGEVVRSRCKVNYINVIERTGSIAFSEVTRIKRQSVNSRNIKSCCNVCYASFKVNVIEALVGSRDNNGICCARGQDGGLFSANTEAHDCYSGNIQGKRTRATRCKRIAMSRSKNDNIAPVGLTLRKRKSESGERLKSCALVAV